MSAISEESPLADQLKQAVQQKMLDSGWTQDEDDMSLAEYIVLMVANGKTQDQIASELSTDLLPEAEGTAEFAQWLTEHVARLTGAAPSEDTTQTSTGQEESSIPAAYDNDLGDNAPDNAYVPGRAPVDPFADHPHSPRGPKGLHGGPRAGRGGRGDSRGRGNFDSALHRTRGNDRISSHNSRGVPKGPRGGRDMRAGAGMQKALNGMANAQMQGQGQPGQMPSMQQQMDMMQQFMETSAQFMAQYMPGGMDPNMSPNGHNAMGGGNNRGRSMFDRVDRGGGRGRGRGGHHQNGNRKPSEAADADTQSTEAMDTSGASTLR